MPRTLKAYADEGFSQNPVVYMCISRIAEACSSVKLEVHSFDKNGDKKVVSTSKVLELLNQPNPTQSWTDFIQEMVAWHRLDGELFILRLPEKGPPQELYCLNPEYVDIEKDRDGSAVPVAYTYGSGEKKKRYPVNPVTGESQVLHVKTFNPSDPFRGLPPMSAGARAVDIHNNGLKWNSSLLKNGARPSGIVEFEKGTPNETVLSQMREYFKKAWQGVVNAGNIPILTGGAKFTALSHNPKDMDFEKSMGLAAKDIALVYGVPLPLVTMEAATFSNMDAANESLWVDTVLPLLNNLTAALSRFLMPLYGLKGQIISYNADSVPALEGRRERLYKRMFEATGSKPLITQDEARAELGFEELGGEAAQLVQDKPEPDIEKALKSCGYSDVEVKALLEAA